LNEGLSVDVLKLEELEEILLIRLVALFLSLFDFLKIFEFKKELFKAGIFNSKLFKRFLKK
jgi:hypothetical protein